MESQSTLNKNQEILNENNNIQKQFNNKDKSNGERLVAKTYRLIQKIFENKSKSIWKAQHIQTNKIYCVKFSNDKNYVQKLYKECKIIDYLNENQPSDSSKFMRLYHIDYKYGWLIVVTDFVQDSLQKKLSMQQKEFNSDTSFKKFSIQTVLLIAEQLIEKFEILHSKGLLYKNISLKNFVVDQDNNIFIKNFHNAIQKHKEIENDTCKDFSELTIFGDANFASKNTLLGLQYSEKDDMQSLGYMFVYLLNGFLPFSYAKIQETQQQKELKKEIDFLQIQIDKKKKKKQSISIQQNIQKNENKKQKKIEQLQKLEKQQIDQILSETYQIILQKRFEISNRTLCKYLPKCIEQYLSLCDCLDIGDKPNYQQMKDLFTKQYDDLSRFERNNIYDWNKNKINLDTNQIKFQTYLYQLAKI